MLDPKKLKYDQTHKLSKKFTTKLSLIVLVRIVIFFCKTFTVI